jgi:arylsulfatase A-like enzyme
MYEGGVRVPFVVRWPGVIEAGSRTPEPVTTVDLYPTLLAVAGTVLLPEQHIDGKSILPLLRDEPFTRGPIFWHYPHYSNQGGQPAAAVRHGDWKLIRFYDGGREELYNLREDIAEQNDVAAKEPEVTRRLSVKLDNWASTVGCRIPEQNPYDPFDDVEATRNESTEEAER